MSDEKRKLDKTIEWAIRHWHLWLVLAGGIVACINFYNTVKIIEESRKKWESSYDQRKKESDEWKKNMEVRMAISENDIEWLKGQP